MISGEARWLDLGGWPVVLADTAGLRASSDAIEQEGVRRARARADEADLRLTIPMRADVNSLNVSITAAVCLWEARRLSPAPGTRPR